MSNEPTAQRPDASVGHARDAEDEITSQAGADDAPPATSELVAASDDDSGEAVEHPTRLLRIASMVRGMLAEVQTTELDEAGRQQLADIHNRALGLLREVVSDDLAAELDDVALSELEDDPPTGSQLRVAQAQLAGWLEGLFHGIQASMATRQLSSRRQQALQQATEQGRQGATGHYL